MPRILVVDDEPSMRALMETVLKSAGHSVHTACDGLAGVEEHEETPFDLIVMDSYMPRLNGADAIRQLRRKDKKVRILAITGLTDVEHPLADAVRAGANRILEKPFHPHELLSTVAEMFLEKR